MGFGRGSVELAYRPIAVAGSIAATELALGMNSGDPGFVLEPEPIEPLDAIPAAVHGRRSRSCCPNAFDGLPEVELFDLTTSTLATRLPHLTGGQRYAVAEPERYVDPATGTVLVRFVNEPRPDRLQLRPEHQRGGRMSDIVRTEGLVKRYDGTLAVAGVDLDVAAGEIFGLVGPNGAGKTTTLRILATLLLPSAGHAEIAGWSVTRNPDQVRRVLGFMPDAFGVYDDMKVWEYLDFFARCYGIAPGRAAPDDRRPAGARRPGRQARRLRPDPVARHAAAAVPGPRPRPRPGGAAPRRAGVRPGPARPGRAARAAPRAARDGQDDPHQQPHPPRAGGAVHERGHRRSRPGAGPGPRRRHRAPAALRGRAPGPRAARGRGPRSDARPVRGRCRRRQRGPPPRRHDRARLPRRRCRQRPAVGRVVRGRACPSSASPGRRATWRSCSCRSPPPTANRWLRRRRPT